MTNTLGFAIQLARQTGELLLEHFHSKTIQLQLKSDNTAVTQADLAADRLISNAIQKAYPRDLLVSEELQSTLPNSPGEHTPGTWIIDPLDGTTNFSLGLQIWGVSIARLENGWPRIAVLYFPAIDEMYHAQSQGGAFLNGDRIQVEASDSNSPLSFFCCCSRTYRQYQVDVPYKTRILGSAAYTFCLVARGLAILGFESTPKIWDIAAAWLLVTEADGVIETLDGSQPFPLRKGYDYERKSFPTLAANGPEILRKSHHQIQPK